MTSKMGLRLGSLSKVRFSTSFSKGRSALANAGSIVPLVLRTLFLAARKRFAEHRAIARWTLPLWLYVSVTGVAVYWMLYRWKS